MSGSNRSVHKGVKYAGEEPQCQSEDTLVTCWGDGELFQEPVRDSGMYALYTKAQIQSGITIIGKKAFYGCKRLTEIELPSSVVELRSNSFQGTAFTTFTVGKSITTIDPLAWNTCSSLTHINVNSGNKKYSSHDGFLFRDGNLLSIGAGRCRGETLVLPDCSTILSGAVRHNRCTELVISDETTTIKSSAMVSCTFTKITLGKSLNAWDKSALSSCTSLTTFNLNGNTNFYFSDDKFGEGTSTAPLSILWIGETVTSLSIPLSVTSVGYSILQSRTKLSLVSVESGHTYFNTACKGKLLLNKINGKSTELHSCIGSVTSITVPENVVTLTEGCFRDCILLEEIILRSGVNNFHYSVFQRCKALTTIDFGNCTMLDLNGKAQTTSNMFYTCSVLTTVKNWPTNDFELTNNAFGHCGFTSLTLPKTCIAINVGAFIKCINLVTITIPNTVTIIGTQVFDGCTSLETVIFEEGSTLTTVESEAFALCPNLTAITLPSTITSLAGSCFSEDTNLVNIEFDFNTGVYIGDGGSIYMKSGGNAYYTFALCCPGLDVVSLHSETRVIGRHAFYGCNNLVDVKMNDKLTTIDQSAFLMCTTIKMIRIPSNVMEIGHRAFDMCTNLRQIFYCGSSDVSYTGQPFPNGILSFYVATTFPHDTGCSFCGKECQAILDPECNLATERFTFGFSYHRRFQLLLIFVCKSQYSLTLTMG